MAAIRNHPLGEAVKWTLAIGAFLALLVAGYRALDTPSDEAIATFALTSRADIQTYAVVPDQLKLAAARIFRSLAARAETMSPARLRLEADEALFSEKGVHRSMGTDVRRDMMPYLATVKEAAIRGDNRAVTVASLETMRLLCEDLSDQAGKQAAFALIDYAQLATEAQLASPAPDWMLIDSAMDHARSRRKYLPADPRFADAFDKLAMAVADRNQTEMRAALQPLRYLFDAYRGRYDSALPDQAITGGRAATAGA